MVVTLVPWRGEDELRERSWVKGAHIQIRPLARCLPGRGPYREWGVILRDKSPPRLHSRARGV